MDKIKIVKITALFVGISVIIGIAIYTFIPRINTTESNQAIEQTSAVIEKKKKEKSLPNDYIAKISTKGKIKDVYVFDNANEDTLYTKGAGIQNDISSDFKNKDYTFVKGHVETTFKDLDRLVIGDVIEVTLKNGEILKYEVTNIHEQKYLDNNNIYTYTDKVGLSISTCSKNSINKQYPEKVLVVDAILM